MIGDSPGDIEQRLSRAGIQLGEKTDQKLIEVAEEVKQDLEDTSPIDTGEYKNSWYIYSVKENEVWVLNEADHAKYVMLPNSRMVGSPSADLPTSGILHNAEGVAKGHSTDLSSKIQQAIEEWVSEIS